LTYCSGIIQIARVRQQENTRKGGPPAGLFAIQNPAQAVEIQQLINDRNSAMHGLHFPYPPDVMQKIDAADKGLIPTERFAQQEEKMVNGELQADKKKQ